MHLKAVELYGFKSFAGEVRIELPAGLTAFVGPNGGGKSNLVDAIRWALGEQRVRELRAERWEDLLWSGSPRRRPAQLAEVMLEFDNTDGVMARWPETLRVGRRLYRHGDSEYLVGTRAVRLKDLTEWFLDSGLGRAAYAVIGQGRIEATLLQRPAERLQQVEEAAGNTRVQLREQETRQRLAAVARDLVRARDLTVGVQREMAEMAAEAERERRYLALAAEVDRLRLGLKAARRAKLERQMGRLAEQRAAADSRRAVLSSEHDALEAARTALEAVAAQQDAARAKLDARAQECEQARQRWQGRLESLRAERSQIEGWVREAQQEESRHAAAADGPPLAAEAPDDRLAEVHAALRAVERALVQAEADQAAKERTHQALAAERDRLAALEVGYRRAADRLSGILGPLAEDPARSMAALAQQVEAEAAQLAASDGEMRQQAEQVDRLTQYLSAERERLAALEQQVAQRQARHRVLHQLEAEGEGYGSGVRAVLRAAQEGALEGVLGTLGSLLTVPDPYQVAILATLGGAAQDVVVATDRDARRAVRHLQARGLGRATFLPLDAVRAARPNVGDNDLARQEGVRGWALDLVSMDARVRPAAAHRLGRVLVLERLEDAVALGRLTAFRYRLVTLDGQLVHPGGAITGGSPGHPSSPWTRRAEIGHLAKQLATERPQLAGLRELLASAERERREAVAQLAQREREHHQRQVAHGEAVRRLAAARSVWESQDPGGAEAAERLPGAERVAAEAEAEWRAAGAATQELRSQRAALNSERERWEAAAGERRRAAERWAAVAAEAAERRAAAERRLATLSARAETVGQAVERAAEQLGALDAELRELAGEAATRREERSALREEARVLEDRLVGVRVERGRVDQRSQQLAVEQERVAGQLEELAADPESGGPPVADVPASEREMAALARQGEELGPIRPGSLAAYDALEQRARFLASEQQDVQQAAADLESTLATLAQEVEVRRRDALQQLEQAFAAAVAEMFGGGRGGFHWVTSPEPGLDLWVEPPGKRAQSLGLLSGGEKALGALAWLFALLDVRPAPLVVLDEAEASLDEENARRFALYLSRRRHSQYLVVTHHKSTMEQAAALWGFASDGGGASRLVSVRLGAMPEEVG